MIKYEPTIASRVIHFGMAPVYFLGRCWGMTRAYFCMGMNSGTNYVVHGPLPMEKCTDPNCEAAHAPHMHIKGERLRRFKAAGRENSDDINEESGT